MSTLRQLYERSWAATKDIGPHMEILARYAAQCPLITEFGVREGCSTAALLCGLAGLLQQPRRRLVSYDVAAFEFEQEYKEAAAAEGIEFVFVRGDDCAQVIEPCDLLFIDTIHTYAQLDKELGMHAGQVGRYIIMHDTYTDNYPDSPGSSGMNMWIAILKLCAMGDWYILEDRRNSFGLTVLKRAEREVLT